MGIPMDDIPTPTVASGPASGPSGDRDVCALPLSGLFDEKDRLEAELKALSRVLESVSYIQMTGVSMNANIFMCYADRYNLRSQHGVDMSTSLTTFDGYPRDDLDIAQSIQASVNCHHLITENSDPFCLISTCYKSPHNTSAK